MEIGDPQRESPVFDCTCGYWSMKTMPEMMEASVRYGDYVAACGPVDIWGKVVEHEKAYRSEFAYPKEIWLFDSEHADRLSQMYGVPVRVSK